MSVFDLKVARTPARKCLGGHVAQALGVSQTLKEAILE